ncbi:hypothetical protein Scep_023737 [Stephania cephalantha]|uniref:Uncharacterized protein n=1 Tax=Stephania cephalantha TaxID=152367 RepID=A0AAP0F0P0_9MAGN
MSRQQVAKRLYTEKVQPTTFFAKASRKYVHNIIICKAFASLIHEKHSDR